MLHVSDENYFVGLYPSNTGSQLRVSFVKKLSCLGSVVVWLDSIRLSERSEMSEQEISKISKSKSYFVLIPVLSFLVSFVQEEAHEKVINN